MQRRTTPTNLINEKERNETRGIMDRKYVTCAKYGDVLEMHEGLMCLHPKETCKFRLECPIDLIGKNH